MPLTIEIATHVYLAILTDTGSFHYSNITPKTFDICRRTVEAGVNPAAMARRVFDQNSFGKLKLIGALLAEMDLLDGGRLAVMYLNDDIMNATGTTYNDTEGLINLPLTAREIQAVVFFKLGADGDIHVSMRSKYDVDVRAVAARHGGGGHKNAAGFKVQRAARRRPRRHPAGTRGAPSPTAFMTDREAGSCDAADARRASRRQALGPDFARRRRLRAPRAEDPAHRPHRNARSAGDRPARAAGRPRDAAGAVPGHRREGVHRGHPPRHRRRRPTMRRRSRCR